MNFVLRRFGQYVIMEWNMCAHETYRLSVNIILLDT